MQHAGGAVQPAREAPVGGHEPGAVPGQRDHGVPRDSLGAVPVQQWWWEMRRTTRSVGPAEAPRTSWSLFVSCGSVAIATTITTVAPARAATRRTPVRRRASPSEVGPVGRRCGELIGAVLPLDEEASSDASGGPGPGQCGSNDAAPARVTVWHRPVRGSR